jgi:NAD(P)-dependent dehydrogenase (short-subunit alcohol dehydrogenase family)
MSSRHQTILITGAATGLGKGLASKLASRDRRLIIHFHTSSHEAESLRSTLLTHYYSVDIVRADLTTQAGAAHLASEVKKVNGCLDVLINNAGVYHEAGLMELTEKEWQLELNSTASATFFTTQALAPLLKKRKPAHVVNIGDSSCDRPTARDLAVGYHIGKTGVLILTKSFARELAPDQISVNMISPGYLENSVGLPDPSTVPAGRFGTFEDIASAAEFLISRPDAMLTGSNLILSGGWNLR